MCGNICYYTLYLVPFFNIYNKENLQSCQQSLTRENCIYCRKSIYILYIAFLLNAICRFLHDFFVQNNTFLTKTKKGLAFSAEACYTFFLKCDYFFSISCFFCFVKNFYGSHYYSWPLLLVLQWPRQSRRTIFYVCGRWKGKCTKEQLETLSTVDGIASLAVGVRFVDAVDLKMQEVED